MIGIKHILKMSTIKNHKNVHSTQWQSQPDIWSCKCKFFCVYRPHKEPISKEMNNDKICICMTKCRAGFATARTNEF